MLKIAPTALCSIVSGPKSLNICFAAQYPGPKKLKLFFSRASKDQKSLKFTYCAVKYLRLNTLYIVTTKLGPG